MRGEKREKLREMNLQAHIKTLGLGLLAGVIYSLLNTPESTHAFGIHVYFLLAMIGAASAFIARISIKIPSEKVILLTLTGILAVILSPLLYNAVFIEASIIDEVMLQSFITLLFAGHAAMIGSFSASLLQKLKLKKKFQDIPEKVRSEKSYQYSLSD